MKLNRKQLEEIREKIEAGYIVKRNVREQGKDIAVGLYFPVFSDEGIKAGWLALGLTRPTYQENKEEVEKIIAEAMEKRRAKEEEEARKKREEIKVVEVAYDWETGRRLYALSSQVSKEEWRKIAPYMAHYSTRGEVDAEWDNQYEGWVVKTGCIEKVEDLLNIKPELRLEERRRRAEEELRKEKEARKELKKRIEEIKEAFKEASFPTEKVRVEGEKVENPFSPEDVYGGGEWWVIQEDKIWWIRNNGFDGADWSLNNIETGGAGAIGCFVPYQAGLAEEIRSLKSEGGA